jgi:hypothetical protein
MDNGHPPNFPFFCLHVGSIERKVMSYDSGPRTASLMISTSEAEPDPVSGAFLTLDPEWGKNPDLGWKKKIRIQDRISEILETIFIG